MQKLHGLITFAFLSLTFNTVSSQLQRDTGDLFLEISDLISMIPGHSGDDFSLPSSNELNDWGQTISLLLNHDYIGASTAANNLNYQLIAYYDNVNTFSTYYLLKNAGSNYWGTYIYNPNYCRNLVIQAPHPLKDYNTGKESAHVFINSDACFLMIGGTSRCNHSSFSSCSGTTTVCSGSSESFRISDLAHSMNTTFQSTTDTLYSRNSDRYFVQFHGFSKLTSDPFIILSNGTRNTPSNDVIQLLANNLEQQDALFVDSIKIAHQDISWTRLIGFTNVQGRLINGSSNICNTSAILTNGNFIHMEQEKTRLRDNITGWNKALNAVNNTFDCTQFNTVGYDRNLELNIYPNPSNFSLNVKSNSTIEGPLIIYDLSGKNVSDLCSIQMTSSSSYSIVIENLNEGWYFLQAGNSIASFIKN